MKISRKLLEDGVTLAVLFLSTGAFHTCFVDLSDPNAVTDGSPLIRALWTIFYVIVLLRAIPYRHRIRALISSNKCILLLPYFAVASTIWSIEPRTTFLRGFSLVVTSLIGADFAIRYSIREQIRMLCIVLGMVVLLGIVAQVLFPGAIPILDWNPGNAWSGAFSYKNVWARFIVLTAIVFLCRPHQSRVGKPRAALLMAAAVALILASKSMGGLVVLIATLAVIRSFGVLRWRPATVAMAIAAALVIAIPTMDFVLHDLGSVTALLGRDATFTGRTKIWPLALESIARDPILGHGYEAFWSTSSPEAARIRSAVNWDTPNAHNGYLDQALDLGFAGLVLFCAGWAVTAWRAVKYLRRQVGPEAKWPLAFLVFMLLYQIPEGTLVVGNSIYWIVYVAIACTITEPQHARTMERENREVSTKELELVS